MATFIRPPMKLLPKNATAEDRQRAYDGYVRELNRWNPRLNESRRFVMALIVVSIMLLGTALAATILHP
jgi:hypothetical protein